MSVGKAVPDPSRSDWPQAASIAFYKDGPYIVRGEFEIVSQDGRRIDAGRRTVALCRCGKSRIRPFCDGTHRSVSFRADGAAENASPPSRPPVPERTGTFTRRSASTGAGGSFREPENFDGPLSQAVAYICLAHEVLVTVLAGPVRAEDYISARVAEPLIRSASALVETRQLQPPPTASSELMRGGLPMAGALVGRAVDAIAEHGDDPVIGTVSGLLCDAMWELENGRRQGD